MAQEEEWVTVSLEFVVLGDIEPGDILNDSREAIERILEIRKLSELKWKKFYSRVERGA